MSRETKNTVQVGLPTIYALLRLIDAVYRWDDTHTKIVFDLKLPDAVWEHCCKFSHAVAPEMREYIKGVMNDSKHKKNPK